jgi:tRNA A37 threonylcarbamoyladenosine dehydratase
MNERFARLGQLIGEVPLKKLANASVAICGLGAVGSFACEALARAGVGRLVLVDFDTIKPSNCNRQIFALSSTMGQCKADVAAQRVRDINPDCTVTGLPEFLDAVSIPKLLEQKPEVVIDAIDSVSCKVALIVAVRAALVPVISCMGAGSKLDPLQFTIGDLAETSVCPLARTIRKRLHKHDIHNGVRCVFSTEKPKEAGQRNAPDAGEYKRGRIRNPIGTISYMPAIEGNLAAAEAIKIILSTLR